MILINKKDGSVITIPCVPNNNPNTEPKKEESSMKCDLCRNKKGEILQKDESGGGSYFEYCSKGHWEGSGLQNENLEWENCPDFDRKDLCILFERDIVDFGIKIINDHGKRLYANTYGYIHCHHNRDPLIEVTTSFGNKSFICNQCGEVVKKELTPTNL